MTYCVVIAKATIKPYIACKDLSFEDALKNGSEIYDSWKLLNSANVSATGVSVRIINSNYIENLKIVEIGDPTFYGIPCDFSMGAI